MTDIHEIEADIEQTRERLGETIDAIGEKLDVKSHVKSTADQAKDRAIAIVSSNWREIAVVATWAVLVTIVWKKY